MTISQAIFQVCFFISCMFSALSAAENSDLSQVSAPSFQVIQSFMHKSPSNYIFVFHNFPINQELIISSSHKTEVNCGYQETKLLIDENNNIISNGKTSALLGLSLGDMPQGARIYFKCTDISGKLIAETSYIPYPYHFESKEGTFSVDVELCDLELTTYQLSYIGLKKNEVFHYHSISDDEILDFDVEFLPNMSYLHTPGVLGKTGGTASFKIHRKSGDSVEFTLPWGTQIPILKEKK